MIILLVLLFIIFLIWLTGVLFANDFSLPSQDIKKFKNVLFIFPHADDEVLNAGGLIYLLSEQKSTVALVILTKGEKGNSDAHYDEKLKNVRTKEAAAVSKILGVTQLIQEDFGDGELINKKSALQKYIDKTIQKIHPDLIITYDLAGLYGHPDHIAVSEVITKLHESNNIPLWYVSFPKRVLDITPLPEHMAKDPQFKDKRAYPTHKVFVGHTMLTKMRAINTYQSQKESFTNSLPIKQIPKEFFYSMQLYEYFSDSLH